MSGPVDTVMNICGAKGNKILSFFYNYLLRNAVTWGTSLGDAVSRGPLPSVSVEIFIFIIMVGALGILGRPSL